MTFTNRYQRMRTVGLFVAAVILLTMVLAACGEPDPQLEASAQQGQSSNGPEGEILFVADDNIMLWDGNVEQVTDGVRASSPTWSPAGDRFAYVAVHDAFSDIVVARRDGSPLVAVTEGHEPDLEEYTQEYVQNASWAWDVDWSPNGEQLIFVSDKGGIDQFSRPLYLWYSETFDVGPYLLNASAEISATQESPAFSPDGDTVAFVVRNEYNDGVRVAEVWLLNLNEATYEQLIVSDDGAYAPDWSPDGDNLAYIQRTGQANDVWIAPVDGEEPYQLTEIGTCAAPIWSPDGNHIVFFRENQGNFEAWYVDVSEDEDGRIVASEPQHLFDAEDIDTVSGMSWHQN